LHAAQRQQDPLELPLMAIIQQRPAGRWNADRAKCTIEAAVEFRGLAGILVTPCMSSSQDTLRAVRSELRATSPLTGPSSFCGQGGRGEWQESSWLERSDGYRKRSCGCQTWTRRSRRC
jgi:hypothetical protein